MSAKDVLEKAEADWIKAKASGKKDAAYRKAEAALIEARNDYRENHRTAPDGPGDGSVTFEKGA